MKIVKCSKCSKYIHKAKKCFHCGNTIGFDEVEVPLIHENAIADYYEVENLIESRKFSEALKKSHFVIEWMPNLPSIFMLRLLAKKQCASVEELLQKGFDCENDADFCNALNYSSGKEKDVYVDIKNLIITLKKALKEKILEHEYQGKLRTNVLQISNTMEKELNSRKEKLFSLWAQLESIEQSMYILEKNCYLLSKEYKDTLEIAAQAAVAIKNEVYRLEECTRENLHQYQIKMGEIIQRSEQSKGILEDMMKSHPWIKEFNKLVKERNEQVQIIENELSTLRSYETSIEQIIYSNEKMEQLCRSAIEHVEKYDFQYVASVLGQERYKQALKQIVCGIDVTINVPTFEWQEKDTLDSDTYEIEEMEEDIEEDYGAWGLPNDSY